MEERKTDQQRESLSQKDYDPSLEEEKDKIPEEEKELEELPKKVLEEKELSESKTMLLNKTSSDNKSVGRSSYMKKIRVVAGIFLIIAIAGIVWFNLYYKGEEALYQTTTTIPTQTTTEKETETEEPTVSKEDVLSHYKNLAIVDGNVDKYLNIREKPVNDAQIIGKYIPYSYVNIVKKEKDGWYEIELEGQKGYVSDKHVLTGKEAEKLALEHGIHKVKVSQKGIKGYDGNNKNANELVELVSGDSYQVVKERKDGWILIRARHNTECFVKAEEVEDGYYLNEGILFTGEGEISQTRLDFLNNAWQYLGGKYVWGGEELGVGVDCSGYIWKLLQQYDIHIHRVSIEQSQDGKEVKEEDMRPGDFIFYINRGDQISHIAIYTGSKTILHAASEEKGICLDAWDYLKPEAIRNVFGD